MNIEKDVSSEIVAFSNIKAAARNQYSNILHTKNPVPFDYHVAFFLVRQVRVGSSGTVYSIPVSSWKETAFFEAVENFKHSVEYFADGNVNIIVHSQNNTIQLHLYTGVAYAQHWKFLLQNDNSFRIVPRGSLTRGMKSNNTSMALSTAYSSWSLEKV